MSSCVRVEGLEESRGTSKPFKKRVNKKQTEPFSVLFRCASASLFCVTTHSFWKAANAQTVAQLQCGIKRLRPSHHMSQPRHACENQFPFVPKPPRKCCACVCDGPCTSKMMTRCLPATAPRLVQVHLSTHAATTQRAAGCSTAQQLRRDSGVLDMTHGRAASKKARGARQR